MKICTLGDMKNNILQNVVSLNYQLLHVKGGTKSLLFFVIPSTCRKALSEAVLSLKTPIYGHSKRF